MIVHQVYAFVHEQTVKNVCVCENYETANEVARCVFGDEAFAVDCLQYPCQEGDRYVDGVFYKADGTQIQYVPTPEQQVEQLTAQNTEMTLALADLIGGAANAE